MSSTAYGGLPRATEQGEETSVERLFNRVGHSVSSFWGPVVLLDLALGLSLTFVMYPVTATLPGGVLVAVAMTAIGAFRRARIRVKGGGLLALAMLSLLVFLAVESRHNGMPWIQRDSKFMLLLLAATVIASGRINVRSLLIGGLLGAVLNVPAFYLHLTPNNYPPYLTGYFADKNVAGMYYALWGVLGLMVLPQKWRKYWIAASILFLFLTGSRTSMAAYGLALAYLFLRHKGLGVFPRLFAMAAGFWMFKFFEDNFASSSAFGDRKGDDWFRQQIEAAMSAKVAITPWYGMGLNQGKVLLGGIREIFFHNSYQQAFVEGGWPFLLVICVAFAGIGLGLFDRRAWVSPNLVRLEAAIIVVLICAWKLGEVFMTLGAFLVLGMCLAYRWGVPADTPDIALDPVGRAERTREQKLDDAVRQNERLPLG